MARYNQPAITEDEITVTTYYKCSFVSPYFQNIQVTDMSDLLVGGTVQAQIGDTDDVRSYNKTQLVCLINTGCYSLTA